MRTRARLSRSVIKFRSWARYAGRVYNRRPGAVRNFIPFSTHKKTVNCSGETRTDGQVSAIGSRPLQVYLVFAVFNFFALAGALHLNHRLSATLADGFEASAAWRQHLAHLGTLRAVADELIDAIPGNAERQSAYSRNNLDEKLLQLNKRHKAARTSVRELFSDLGGGGTSSTEHKRIDESVARFNAVELALLSMTAHATQLADANIARGAPAMQSSVNDVMRAHHEFRKQYEALLKHLHQLQSSLEKGEGARIKTLTIFENVLIIVTLLLLCVMAWCGDQLGKLLRSHRDEIVTAHAAVARIESEMRQFAQQHDSINNDVSKLNVDLANSILKLKEAQDEILKRGKLAQLGQLTATVAHEIRNPLGAIRTATFLVERKIKDKGLGVEKQVERINNGVKRCDTIITELLDFARSRSLQLKTVTVDEWIRQKVQEEAGNLPPIVEFVCHLGLGDTQAAFDLDRMHRVFINLLTNASEAMVGKASEPVLNSERASKIQITTELVSGNVEISVSDNGPGITEDNLKKILEPLFTTKSFGVGLGLPAVEKILEQHGGGLRIKSTVGEGATFTAFFPLQQRVANAA